MADPPASIGFATGGFPVLGHAWWLRFRPLEFLKAQRVLGDIVVFRIGPKRAYLVNNPELVHQMLTTRRNDFIKGGPLFDTGRALVGDGVGTSHGDRHRRQRRLIQPAFHPSRFPAYCTIMSRAAAATVDSWRDGQQLEVNHQMYTLSATMMATCLYSGRLANHAVEEVIRSLPTAFDGIGRRAALPLRWLHALPTPGNWRYTQALNRLHTLTDRLIADYRTNGTDHDDVLSTLLTAHDADTGEPMSDQQIHDEVLTLITAATDAAAQGLSWTLHLLGHHPDVENSIRTELDRVLGGRAITYADLPNLTYLHATVAESLRLYPPVWLIPRRAATHTHLGDHPIPSGSYVFYSPFANHHDPRLYPEPETFTPDRWLHKHTTPPSCAHIPFGAGVRKCMGDTFAITETMITLATILQHWQLRPHPDHPVQPRVFTTLHTGRLVMTAHRRNDPRQ